MATIWYFTQARETRKRVAITAADFQYLLCVLPPIYAKGCYGLNEPVDHNAQGQPEYLWFTERNGAYFCLHGTRTEAEIEFNDTENKEPANPSKSQPAPRATHHPQRRQDAKER